MLIGSIGGFQPFGAGSSPAGCTVLRDGLAVAQRRGKSGCNRCQCRRFYPSLEVHRPLGRAQALTHMRDQYQGGTPACQVGGTGSIPVFRSLGREFESPPHWT